MIHAGDCLDVLPTLDVASIDAIVADPPYGIGFMGHEWDQPGEFGPVSRNGRPRPFASGTDHRELERQVARSQRRASQRGPASGAGHRRDRAAAAEGEPPRPDAMQAGRYDLSPTATRRYQAWCEAWAAAALRVAKPGAHMLVFGGTRTYHRLVAGIEDAGWEIRDCLVWAYAQGFPKSLNLPGGLGTALKPAWEPIVLARRPLIGSVAVNVAALGTGALNIDGTRIPVGDAAYTRNHSGDRGHAGTRTPEQDGATDISAGGGSASALGRWPPNLLLTDPIFDGGTDGVVGGGEQSGGGNPRWQSPDASAGQYGGYAGGETGKVPMDTAGTYSRFFVIPKADRAEREPVIALTASRTNTHPTVKPIDLMRHLVRLVTPPGGTVLDPFLGSGTTALAAELEGFGWIGIEREAEYVAIAEARLNGTQRGLGLAFEPTG